MKKTTILLLLVAAASLQYCSSSRKAQKDTPKTTYEAHVQPVISQSCSPCHIEGKGKATPLNNFAAAKANIDESLRRIQLNPGDKGFMPMRHPKLPDSTIQVFVQWKADGLLEK